MTQTRIHVVRTKFVTCIVICANNHSLTRGSWFTILTLFMTKTYRIYHLTENLTPIYGCCGWYSCPKRNL